MATFFSSALLGSTATTGCFSGAGAGTGSGSAGGITGASSTLVTGTAGAVSPIWPSRRGGAFDRPVSEATPPDDDLRATTEGLSTAVTGAAAGTCNVCSSTATGAATGAAIAGSSAGAATGTSTGVLSTTGAGSGIGSGSGARSVFVVFCATWIFSLRVLLLLLPRPPNRARPDERVGAGVGAATTSSDEADANAVVDGRALVRPDRIAAASSLDGALSVEDGAVSASCVSLPSDVAAGTSTVSAARSPAMFAISVPVVTGGSVVFTSRG